MKMNDWEDKMAHARHGKFEMKLVWIILVLLLIGIIVWLGNL